MERLIKNGDIVLNGTKTRYEAEKDAFKKLEEIEELLDTWGITSIRELHRLLLYYWKICNIKNELARQDQWWEEQERRISYVKSKNKG